VDENAKTIQSLFSERWTNGACLGYAIKAMENADFPPDDIRLVALEMRELFDRVSTTEANKHYCNSPY
jgi:hypothetical protein